MEPPPALDASRPSPLRLAGFAVTVFGALIAGVGAVQTWVTVGIAGQPQLDAPTKGTDVWQGLVVLGCAAVMLVAVLASRVLARRARAVAGGVVTGAGVVCAAVSGAFLATASSVYSPIDDQRLVDALAKATGATADEVRTKACETIGCVTTLGAGAWLALLGGVLGFVGGILVLAWATRVATDADRTGVETTDV